MQTSEMLQDTAHYGQNGRLEIYHKQALALILPDHFDRYPRQEADPYGTNKRET